jgi:3,4-dihydroxy-2-butanone 4-phosphate synthase
MLLMCDDSLQLVIVVADENEGGLIMSASKATPEAMAFIGKELRSSFNSN